MLDAKSAGPGLGYLSCLVRVPASRREARRSGMLCEIFGRTSLQQIGCALHMSSCRYCADGVSRLVETTGTVQHGVSPIHAAWSDVLSCLKVQYIRREAFVKHAWQQLNRNKHMRMCKRSSACGIILNMTITGTAE